MDFNLFWEANKKNVYFVQCDRREQLDYYLNNWIYLQIDH